MKAEINQYGQLKISAETEIEAYALRCWTKDQVEAGVELPCFVIKCGLDDEKGDCNYESRD